MLNVLKNNKTFLGFEVIGSYTAEDMQTVEFLFEQKIKMGAKKINILIKLDKLVFQEDKLSLDKKSLKFLFKEAVYAFKNRKRFRNIALVGNSHLVKRAMFKLDKLVFQDKSKTMIEKYFDVKHMQKAWLFLKSPKDYYLLFFSQRETETVSAGLRKHLLTVRLDHVHHFQQNLARSSQITQLITQDRLIV